MAKSKKDYQGIVKKNRKEIHLKDLFPIFPKKTLSLTNLYFPSMNILFFIVLDLDCFVVFCFVHSIRTLNIRLLDLD